MTTESQTAPARFTLPELAAMKPRGDKIVMVTAYDAPGARLADEAGIELILVGDSAAMVVLGHDSTVPATVDEMIVLTRAARRGGSAWPHTTSGSNTTSCGASTRMAATSVCFPRLHPPATCWRPSRTASFSAMVLAIRLRYRTPSTMCGS